MLTEEQLIELDTALDTIREQYEIMKIREEALEKEIEKLKNQ